MSTPTTILTRSNEIPTLTSGNTYRVTCWIRSSGSGVYASLLLPDGTESTTRNASTWIQVDHTVVSNGSTVYLKFYNPADATGWVEFDELNVYLITPTTVDGNMLVFFDDWATCEDEQKIYFGAADDDGQLVDDDGHTWQV